MQVKIKKLNENAVIPRYAKKGDAGLDLVATSRYFDKYGNAVYGTGLAVEIPEGYVGLIFPRSSISKYDLSLSNSVGVIDSGYRGEIMFKFTPTASFTDLNAREDTDSETFDCVSLSSENRKDAPDAVVYEVGEKIGQLIIMPYPQIQFVEVEELSDSERGEGGFGSTGNK